MHKFEFKTIIKEAFKNKFTVFVCIFFSIILWIFTIMYGNDSRVVVKIKDIPIVSNFLNIKANQYGKIKRHLNKKN